MVRSYTKILRGPLMVKIAQNITKTKRKFGRPLTTWLLNVVKDIKGVHLLNDLAQEGQS